MAMKTLGKVNARTRYLARRARLLDRETLKILASSLVLCHMDYAVNSWYWGLTQALKHKLQVAQNKLIRTVEGLGNRSHVGKAQFTALQWLPVEERAQLSQLNLVHRIQKGRAPNYLQNYFKKTGENHDHNTRASVADLSLSSFKSRTGKNSFRYLGAKEWNQLPLAIKQTRSSDTFKKKTKHKLLDRVRL